MSSKKENGLMIKTAPLHLVDVRFYEGHQVEVEDEEKIPKAIVFEYNGVYTNVVTGEDNLPYLTRLPYTNDTIDHVEFGSKLQLKTPDLLKDKGVCYVEVLDPFIEQIKAKEYISSRQLEDKILNSSLYFKDRIRIIEQRINNGERRGKLMKLAHKDHENNCDFSEKLARLNGTFIKKKSWVKAKKVISVNITYK